jgi:radical SAM superfamily enzyme YgiQ (UPF0313 family)
MELPSRPAQDRFLKPGRFSELQAKLRSAPGVAEIPTLILHAFDFRTRMLPFITADSWIVPAGIRAVSAALSTSGFTGQRVVNQTWNPNVRVDQSRIGGRIPEMVLVSAMQIHFAEARRMIREAHAYGADRPLVIVGGPKAIYQPWDYFHVSPSPDLVCTGEEFVLLELMDRLLEYRRTGDSMRTAFERARLEDALDDIPGLMFEAPGRGPNERELIDTGVQRLLRDFDELPDAIEGFKFLERPHRGKSIGDAPVPLNRLIRHTRVASVVTTRGCKFRCGYCPIPAYNQFSWRTKSPEGLVRDIQGLRRQIGLRYFFGTDDNFFNDEDTVVTTFEALAKADFAHDDIGKSIRFATEATIFDVHKQKDLLPLAYKAGLRAVWFGIEDLTAELINKGQNVPKTEEVFTTMRRQKILPMAMMMHYDGQPLTSPKGTMNGLLNQIDYLYSIGAGSVQVTVLGPAAGTKDYREVMEKGIILKELGGEPVEDYCWDGNHVISVGSVAPWKLQRNVLLGYARFYNPLNMIRSPFRANGKKSDIGLQLWGMYAVFRTALQLLPWMWKLWRHGHKKNATWSTMPAPQLPVRAVGVASMTEAMAEAGVHASIDAPPTLVEITPPGERRPAPEPQLVSIGGLSSNGSATATVTKPTVKPKAAVRSTVSKY